MKEREFQGWVIGVAHRQGWRVWHVPTPMRPIGGNRFVPDPRGAGLPDLILIHDDPPRLIFAECKTDTDLSEPQKEFLRLARGVAEVAAEPTRRDGGVSVSPIGVYVFRPGAEALIETLLRSKVTA